MKSAIFRTVVVLSAVCSARHSIAGGFTAGSTYSLSVDGIDLGNMNDGVHKSDSSPFVSDPFVTLVGNDIAGHYSGTCNGCGLNGGSANAAAHASAGSIGVNAGAHGS